MNKVPVSFLVPVKNEAANLPRCLESIAWADEIWVVDSQSTDGTQAIVVHNADNTLVTASRPLQRGEFAYLYASALGPVANQPATGAGAPSLPLAATTTKVTVLVGGVPSEVQFAGLAPGLVGVYQVNFRVPANAPVGGQSLMVTVGDASSPAASITVN